MKEVKPRTLKLGLELWHMMASKKNGRIPEHLILLE
jgi:hypothetical protein